MRAEMRQAWFLGVMEFFPYSCPRESVQFDSEMKWKAWREEGLNVCANEDVRIKMQRGYEKMRWSKIRKKKI